MKRLSRRQALAKKAAKRKRIYTNPAAIRVGTVKQSGGKRKGRSMKRPSTVFRSGTVTREMLDNAPGDALAYVNATGRVKRLDYTRKG